MFAFSTKTVRTFAAVIGCVGALAWSPAVRADKGKNEIASVVSGEEGEATIVRIRGTRTPTFSVYKLDRPARVVVDVANAQLGMVDAKPTWNVNSWAVGQVAAHATVGAGETAVRVVVNLARPSTYKVRADGSDVVIAVTPRERAPKDARSLGEAQQRIAAAEDAERKAVADAKAARAEAQRTHKEAEQAMRVARERNEQMLARAKEQAESAKREVLAAREEAKRAQDQATERDRAAAAQIAAAKKMADEATARLAEARQMKKAAADEATRAQERDRAARSAERRAQTQRTEAELAEKAAAELADRAKNASRTDSGEALVLHSQADEAARNAEARRQRAEQAAAVAETKRREAEALALAADLRRKEAIAAVTAAEVQRDKAEQSRRMATGAQQAAEQRRAEAERAAIAAEKRASALKQAASEAEQRAASARELRQNEQRAAAEEAKAREVSDRLRRATDTVARKVNDSIAAAREAKDEAARQRAEVLAASRRAQEIAAQTRATAQDIEAARAEALRLERALAQSETQAAERQRAATAMQDEAKRLGSERTLAAGELEKLRRKAAAAKQRREREERALAGLEQRRAKAERELEQARKARRDAETALRKAEADRESTATREQAESERKLGQAERELDEARMARAAMEDRLGQMEQKHAAVLAEVKAEAKARATELERVREQARAREAELATAQRLVKAREQDVARAKQDARAARETALAEAREQAAKREAALARAQKQASDLERALAAATAAKPANAGTNKSTDKLAEVRDVDYVDKDGTGRVMITLSGPAEPKVVEAKGRRAVLQIDGVTMNAALERTLDTSRLSGPVKSVSSYRDPERADRVRVVVDLERPVDGVLVRSGHAYSWEFPTGGGVVPAARGPAKAPASRPARRNAPAKPRAEEFPPTQLAGYGASSGPITQQTVSQMNRKRKVYRGRKIDLDFKDADIHNLLRLLADVGGVNIVIPDNVTASVTVRLRNVPWDQAMEVILASKGLWYRREGSLIRIAPREQLDEEDEKEAARIAAMVKAEPPEPQIFTLNYATASGAATQLRPLLSPKGRIEIDERTNSLIINDIAAHRRRIIDLVTALDTQTPQIQIEARIVEARTSFNREFGIQWGGNVAATAAGGNATGLVFPSDVSLAGAADDGATPTGGLAASPSNFAVNLPAAIGTGAGGGIGLSLGSVGGNVNLNLRLSAAEDLGSIRIISAPKITTSNNIQASIKSGTSIPISVVSANGVQTQFVPADLLLDVTPAVSQRDCSISMEVRITKNEADFANTGARGDPSILTKEAKTTILVGDGETSVIGGIYTRNTGLNYNKVPFFADIPVIGYFFKNRAENDERSEVLVFITPKITNRAFLRCD